MKSLHKTAILVFAHSATKELEHKAMPDGRGLFETLTQETLQKVKRTRLPYFHISEKEQIGNSFGERFTNAIETVFKEGFDNIITIGNDTPQLKTAHLLKTKAAVEAGKTVLGPSLDGGFYLMGIHKSNFKKEMFKSLPWQRFSLFNRISTLLNQSDSVLHQLPVLSDLDSLNDVKRLISFKRLISSTVLQLLILLVKLENNITDTLALLLSDILLLQPTNKGSPIVLHS